MSKSPTLWCCPACNAFSDIKDYNIDEEYKDWSYEDLEECGYLLDEEDDYGCPKCKRIVHTDEILEGFMCSICNKPQLIASLYADYPTVGHVCYNCAKDYGGEEVVRELDSKRDSVEICFGELMKSNEYTCSIWECLNELKDNELTEMAEDINNLHRAVHQFNSKWYHTRIRPWLKHIPSHRTT